jgi:hypothetical protein
MGPSWTSCGASQLTITGLGSQEHDRHRNAWPIFSAGDVIGLIGLGGLLFWVGGSYSRIHPK